MRLAERKQQRPRPASAGEGRQTRPSFAPERECTFKPTINAVSLQREPRSFTDLSLGDQRRREVRVAKMREDLNRKNISSFKPQITEYEGACSRLRVLEEPDTLVERMSKVRQGQLARREKDAQKTRAEELSQCTFAPKVQPIPGFVRQLAASHRLTRELREK